MEPESGQQRRPTPVPPLFPRGLFALWLAAAALVLLSLPLFALLGNLQQDVMRMEDALTQARLARLSPVPPEDLPALRATATALAGQEDALQNAAQLAAGQRIPWAAVLDQIAPLAPAEIRITGLRQQQDTVTVQGVAQSQQALTAYVGRLRSSPLFADVQVVSSAITTTPTPAPTATPTRTPSPSPSPTITPIAGDRYEPDDTPAPLDLGSPQVHSFYPAGDVDRARFTGKAAHRYRIYTSQLAPGVDTILAVNAGGTVYTNEDRTPGDLSSRVEFSVPAPGDVLIDILITNRGRFAPDATYVLTAEEVGTGDSYEPDDRSPAAISPGEVQQRSFYPERDVDLVQFPVKAGRWYEVSTRSLATGVDTVLTVSVDQANYQSDDIGAGNYASRVYFQAQADTVAYVAVTNKDRYGPNQTYELAVSELGAPPAITPAPTAASGQAALTQLAGHPAAVEAPAHGANALHGNLAPAGLRPAGRPAQFQPEAQAGPLILFVITLRLRGGTP